MHKHKDSNMLLAPKKGGSSFGIELIKNLEITVINIKTNLWFFFNVKFQITTTNYKLVAFFCNSESKLVTILHYNFLKNFYKIKQLFRLI